MKYTWRDTMLIYERVWKSEQTWHYEWVWREEEHSFKVHIKRNFYDFQSNAKVFKHDGDQWQLLITRPITLCECACVSTADPHVTIRHFLEDSQDLQREAYAIMNIGEKS